MYGVVFSLVPAFLVSLYVFGMGALIITAISIVSCVLAEMIIQKYILKTEIRISDGSAIVTGLLLAFNLPSNLPWWMIVLGALFAIGIGKMTYGGLGNNPFQSGTCWAGIPADFISGANDKLALARCYPGFNISMLQPEQLRWVILKEAVRNGETVPDVMNQIPDHMQLFLGQMGGSLGEVSALALILGFVWLLYKQIITWHIPVFMVATIFIFTGILWLIDPSKNASPLFHILTGGVMLGAIYMATDLVTSPMTRAGMILYAAGIGIITVIIRVFGAYPEGVSFAILIMNAFVPLINKYIKPKRFGEEVKHG